MSFRNSNIHIRIKPDKKQSKDEILLPPGTVTSVYQEDVEEVYQKFGANRVALYSATRIYGWNGKELSSAPGEPARQAFAGVNWQNKAGKAARFTYQGLDSMQDLKSFLTQRKMFDELKSVENSI